MSRESTKKGCSTRKCAGRANDCSLKTASDRLSHNKTSKACSSKTSDCSTTKNCSTRNSASKSKNNNARACSERNSAKRTAKNCK